LGGLVRVSFAKPLMLAFLFFGLLTSAAIAATTISINAGGGIPVDLVPHMFHHVTLT